MENAKATDLKEEINHCLVILWSLIAMRRHEAFGRMAQGRREALDPTRGKGRVAAMLQIKDGLSTRELSKVLGIRVSSLNETLAKMEKEGLVQRRPSEHDKRVMLVYLTETGASVNVEAPDDAEMLDGFSDGELEQLQSYLERMIVNAESGLDEEALDEMRSTWEMREQLMAEGGMPGRHPGMHMPPFGRPDFRQGFGFPFDPRQGQDERCS